MPLTDIEKTIQGITNQTAEQDLLRKGASLGLKVAIEDLERLQAMAEMSIQLSENQGLNPVQSKAYAQALKDALVSCKAMLVRAQQGQSTHPSTPVGD